MDMTTRDVPSPHQAEALLSPFRNEAFTDFADSENRRAMEAALAAVRGQLGREYDMIIGGRRLKTGGKIVSTNPAHPSQVIGIHQRCDSGHAELAVEAATDAFRSWSRTPTAERIVFLIRAAELIRKRKFEFCAWLTYEVGKNWAEADADVGETIDFLEFYAREARRLDAATTPIQFPGERNQLRYIPLGVGAVISP